MECWARRLMDSVKGLLLVLGKWSHQIEMPRDFPPKPKAGPVADLLKKCSPVNLIKLEDRIIRSE